MNVSDWDENEQMVKPDIFFPLQSTFLLKFEPIKGLLILLKEIQQLKFWSQNLKESLPKSCMDEGKDANPETFFAKGF